MNFLLNLAFTFGLDLNVKRDTPSGLSKPAKTLKCNWRRKVLALCVSCSVMKVASQKTRYRRRPGLQKVSRMPMRLRPANAPGSMASGAVTSILTPSTCDSRRGVWATQISGPGGALWRSDAIQTFQHIYGWTTTKATLALFPEWATKGLHIHFQSPYSPELKRIEIL